MSVSANWIFCSIPKSTLYTSFEDEPEIRSGSKTVFKVNLKQTWEEVLDTALKEVNVHDVVWIPSKDEQRVQVYFPVKQEDNEYVLNFLTCKGFGQATGTTLAFVPFALYFNEEGDVSDAAEEEDDNVFEDANGDVKRNGPFMTKLSGKLSHFKKIQEDFLKTVTSRLTVAQVVSGVKNSSKVTFDFVMYTFFAGCIASCGIMNDAVTDIAAAMCIEPVMATVLVGAFGTVIQDWSLIKMGLRNNCIVTIECIITGFLYGLIAMIWSEAWSPPAHHFPTSEMVGRAMWRSLVMGALQASAAGGAAALGLLSNNISAMVGVAIACTFLPHAANTGLLWAWVCHLSWRGMNYPLVERNVTVVGGDHVELVWTKEVFLPPEGYEALYATDMRWECMNLSYISLLNCYVNVVCLYASCTLVLILKEVAPLGSFEPNRKFFQEDIKAYRRYNLSRGLRGSRSHSATNDLGGQILREWADITGLDADTLLADSPEARITQLQTLADLALEIENDKNYLSATRAASGIPEPNLLRRLTQGSISLNPAGSMKAIHAFDNPAFMRSMDGLNKESLQQTTTTGLGSQATVHGSAISRIRKRITGRSRVRAESHLSIPEDEPVDSSPKVPELRGVTLDQLGTGKREAVFLKKTLKESDHSPFSIWPVSAQRRPSLDPRTATNTFGSARSVSQVAIFPSTEVRHRNSSSAVSIQLVPTPAAPISSADDSTGDNRNNQQGKPTDNQNGVK